MALAVPQAAQAQQPSPIEAAIPGPPEPADEAGLPDRPVSEGDSALGPGPPEPHDARPVEVPDWVQPELRAPAAPALDSGAEEAEPSVRRGPRALLELAGISESSFFSIQDGEPLSVDEHEVMLKILYRVRKFDLLDIAQWTQTQFSWRQLAEQPAEHRGEMFLLAGRVRKVTVAKPPIEVVDQYQLPQYYLCEMEVGPERLPATIITANIPESWPVGEPIDERASAAGLFFKAGRERGDSRALIFIAQRVAWHPDRIAQTPATNFSMTVLGDLGMDVGLLAEVENRSPIGAQDREAFYQMLWAVEQAGTAQLFRFAQQNLDRLTKNWKQEAVQLDGRIAELREAIAQPQEGGQGGEALAAELKQARIDRAIVDRALDRAAEGASSIFPLFNRPDEQHGRLVVLEGNARRAVKVIVGSPDDDTNVDIVARYGIDHYYELEMFTPDSENNPVVVCVRELPQGFPTGSNINEGVRVAGFFFKTWAFNTQKGAAAGADGEPRRRQQLAPLLVGREPLWLQPPSAAPSTFWGLLAGGLFLAALAGIWLWLWRFNRSDEEFHKKVLAKHYAIDEGVSLDELGIVAEEKPDFSHLEQRSGDGEEK